MKKDMQTEKVRRPKRETSIFAGIWEVSSDGFTLGLKEFWEVSSDGETSGEAIEMSHVASVGLMQKSFRSGKRLRISHRCPAAIEQKLRGIGD